MASMDIPEAISRSWQTTFGLPDLNVRIGGMKKCTGDWSGVALAGHGSGNLD